MKYSYERIKDITSDLASGDINLTEKRNNEADASTYNMVPKGVMVVKASAAVVAIVCIPFGGTEQVTLYLNTNQIYDISLEHIIKAGTTTESILILGVNFS